MNEANEVTDKQLNEQLNEMCKLTEYSVNESLLNTKENSNLFELYFPDIESPLHYLNDNMYDNEACYTHNEKTNLTDKQLDDLILITQKYINNQCVNAKENSNLPESIVYEAIKTDKKEKGTLCIQCNIKEKIKKSSRCRSCIYRNTIAKKPKKTTVCVQCNINEKVKGRRKCYQCIYKIKKLKKLKKHLH